MKKMLFLTISMVFALTACDQRVKSEPTSASGVTQASVKIKTQSNGLTVEQSNVKARLLLDNKIGSIKHLYIISAMSGDVILYSTVKGKVTSSGKRLHPKSVLVASNKNYANSGMKVYVNGEKHYTSEVLQDDGTYGSSIPYIYWFDVRGVYHQHYVGGGQIIHVSSEPIAVGKIIINLEK